MSDERYQTLHREAVEMVKGSEWESVLFPKAEPLKVVNGRKMLWRKLTETLKQIGIKAAD